MYGDICIFPDRRDIGRENGESICEDIGECRTSSIVSTQGNPSTRVFIESGSSIFWENPHDLHIVHDIEPPDTLYYMSEARSEIACDDEAFCSTEFMDIVRVSSEESEWIPFITRCTLDDPVSWDDSEGMES